MAKTALTITVVLDGAHETLAAFKQLPKDANKELRQASKELAQTLVAPVRAAASAAPSPQAALVAKTVRAKSDRVPVIQAGGNRRLGPARAPAYKLLFGSEFGSNQYPQFQHVHTGQKGMWFFPVVETETPRIGAAWLEVADKIITKFSDGGGV